MSRVLTIGILLCCMLITTRVYAQNLTFAQANALFGQQRILTFRTFSLELTDEGKEELKMLAEFIRVTPGVIKTNLLIIQMFTCEKELNVKPYIAACRGQVVIDYLERAIGMPRKKCLIQDNGSNQFDKECLAGSGANLYIKPDWRK